MSIGAIAASCSSHLRDPRVGISRAGTDCWSEFSRSSTEFNRPRCHVAAGIGSRTSILELRDCRNLAQRSSKTRRQVGVLVSRRNLEFYGLCGGRQSPRRWSRTFVGPSSHEERTRCDGPAVRERPPRRARRGDACGGDSLHPDVSDTSEERCHRCPDDFHESAGRRRG